MNANNSAFMPSALKFSGEDTRKRQYLSPVKIVKTWGDVKNTELLSERSWIQAILHTDAPSCSMVSTREQAAAILLDYGCELHGCVRIVTAMHKDKDGKNVTCRLKYRFGESIVEAITPVGELNSTNDHAIRDGVMDISYMAAQETGETGFRYLYIELCDEDVTFNLSSATGVLITADVNAYGSFYSSDERLDRIWQTAAYTVYLNMQEYLWDGIKRDRAVWLGDMNTEVETALAVFGDTELVRRSLDFGVEITPLPKWMNGIPSYSFWWLINVYRIYEYSGDAEYVRKHRNYITGLTRQILDYISPDGSFAYDGYRATFIDWSTASADWGSAKDNSQLYGFMGMLSYTLTVIPALLEIVGEHSLIKKCEEKRKCILASNKMTSTQKIAAAWLSLGDLWDANEADRAIEENGVEGYSTFMGYTILNAKAKAKNVGGAIKAIKDYWGAMLDMGATSFWEDFDIEWQKNSTRIDEMPQDAKPSIHGSFGKHCYVGLRLSLCHGWSAGPCPFLTKHVLGVHIEEAGMKKIRIKPSLDGLSYVGGSVATPYGTLTLRHEKRDGIIYTIISAPSEITLIFDGCAPIKDN